MTIVYDKLLALDIPAVVQAYTEKDAILYALGLGLGHNPLDTDQLPFVYEQGCKVLPTFAAVLGWPGFWARDLDTGIDWVKLVAGEQGLTLHRPLVPRGTVIGKTRVTEIIDKGPGDRRDHRYHDTDHVLPRRWRLWRPAARGPAGAFDSGARARPHLRPGDAAGGGADLPAERRSQPVACRSRGGEGCGLPTPHFAWACDLRHRRPCHS
jgi:hypothetical protein